MNRKELSLQEQTLITELHKQEKSYAYMGKLLNTSRYTIRNVVSRYKNENNTK